MSCWIGCRSWLPCDSAQGLAAIHVDTGRYRLWIGSAHLSWPWPYGQAGQAATIAKTIAPFIDPMILAGDFNMVAWSHTLRRLRRAGGMQLTGRAGPTFKFREVPIELGIDHVFMPDGAKAILTEKRDRFGSDHAGIFASFKLP